MKVPGTLDAMGFVTMTDRLCRGTSPDSPLRRAVVVITEKCNFRCPYCRTSDGTQMALDEIRWLMKYLAIHQLDSLLLTGGEPTLHPDLLRIVASADKNGIPRIGLGTNGSADLQFYRELNEAGVREFSISLDADNAFDGNTLAGVRDAHWNRIVSNIGEISEFARVTVGIVITELNANRIPEIVSFARSLGVADVRLNPAARYSDSVPARITKTVTANGNPFLRWRLNNQANGSGVRGLTSGSAAHCWLAQDEITVRGDNHYPCFVYMREGGDAIGKIHSGMRRDRVSWMNSHTPYQDPICRSYCADCCAAFNQRYEEFHFPGRGGVL